MNLLFDLNTAIGATAGISVTALAVNGRVRLAYKAGRRHAATQIRETINAYTAAQCGDRVRNDAHPKWALYRAGKPGGILDSICRHYAKHRVGYPVQFSGPARMYTSEHGLTTEEGDAGTHPISTARVALPNTAPAGTDEPTQPVNRPDRFRPGT